MRQTKKHAIAFALLAAALFGLGTPLSKLLLTEIPAAYMAAFSLPRRRHRMGFIAVFTHKRNNTVQEAKLTKTELPFIVSMILLDIAAPILLMYGLTYATAANISLITNFEIAATALIALFLFRESVGKHMWTAIALITVSCILLSVEGNGTFRFSYGALLALLACVCWGFENNCTKRLAIKDPMQIVVIKGFGSGIGAFLVALCVADFPVTFFPVIGLALLLGFVSNGLSILFYIRAQRVLGAAMTSAYYAISPFVGALLSFVVLGEQLQLIFAAASILMAAGTYFAVKDSHCHSHMHTEITHEHRHSHDDGHHLHTHETEVVGEHSHLHHHEGLNHSHEHTPDVMHIHKH